VDHFKGDPTRIVRGIQSLKNQAPDVIGLYEVGSRLVFEEVTAQFSGYTFQITEGSQQQEILISGISNLLAFITQRLEFRAGTTNMRQGQLATIIVDGKRYSILFLHLASSNSPGRLNLRDDMAIRAIKFREALNKAGFDSTNYIFLCDLITLGLDYPYSHDVPSFGELRHWGARAKQCYNMRQLIKTHDFTCSNGPGSEYPHSNLDHVCASEHFQFKHFSKPIDNTPTDVSARAWVDETTQVKKDKWIDEFSDHCIFYLEAQ
jgi:hypothetical protein